MELLGLTWSRPLGLLALALPLAVVLLARRAPRARIVASGTVALWREVEVALGEVERRRGGRLPPALWAWVAALALGALALAGPALPAREGPRWRVLVDLGPSLHLPWIGPDGAASGATRLERAIELAVERLGGAQLEWRAWTDAGPLAARGPRPPAAWLRTRGLAPPWPQHDRAGVAWLSDRAPSPPPQEASWIASGGGAVPGPVALREGARIVWDGAGLAESEAAAPARTLRIGPQVADVVAELARLWARERGVPLAEQDSADLLVACPGCARSAGDIAVAGRDGWEAAGPLADSAPAPGDEVWLRAPGGRPLVWWRPGRVELAWDPREPRGDPAAFAVSWSELLDAALPLPQDVVPLLARLDAGAPAADLREPARDRAPEASRLAAALAGLALLLALLGAWASGRGGPLPSWRPGAARGRLRAS